VLGHSHLYTRALLANWYQVLAGWLEIEIQEKIKAETQEVKTKTGVDALR